MLTAKLSPSTDLAHRMRNTIVALRTLLLLLPDALCEAASMYGAYRRRHGVSRPGIGVTGCGTETRS